MPSIANKFKSMVRSLNPKRVVKKIKKSSTNGMRKVVPRKAPKKKKSVPKKKKSVPKKKKSVPKKKKSSNKKK